jgi:hypothetical protein
MTFTIDGTDITPYIAYKGIKWQRADADDEEAGRTLDAVMHRKRVAIKYRADITCIPLSDTDSQILLALIEPEYVTVYCQHPRYGLKTFTMYSNNIPTSHAVEKDGVNYWDGIVFPLIEQ